MYDAEERRLRRLEKRLRHMNTLLNVYAVIGNIRGSRILRKHIRDGMQRTARELWDIQHPDGEPEDLARNGFRAGRCGHPVDK